MEWFVQYQEQFVLALSVLATVLIVIILIYNIRFASYFSNKKFQVRSDYEFDPLTKDEHFGLTVFNKNVNDARIIGFGFVFKDQNIDYFQTYLKDKGFPKDTKVVIPSRDSIKLSISCEALKTILWDKNNGKFVVKHLQVFVIDSLGIASVSNVPQVKNVLQTKLKEMTKAIELEKKRAKAMHEQEQKEDLMNAKLQKKASRKVLKDSFMVKLKARFRTLRKANRG